MDSFDVSILVRPFDIGMSSLIGQIDEGTTQTITCTADGGKPTPSIDWYLLGPDVNRTRLPGSEDAQQYPNGTWYKRSSLTFTVTRQMYQGTLFCLVNTGPIPFYNESFQVHLDVNLSPLMPTIHYFTGLFNNGETSTIRCTSAGSRPAATIDWYLDGAKLKNTIHEVLPRSDGTFFVTGIISVTFDKSMSGRQMRCAASNSVVRNNGVGEVNRSVTLLATYAPEITSENGTREVTEDSDVVLTCQVVARPMPTPKNIFWRHNNNIISTGTGSRFNYTAGRVADLRISSVKREDAGDYVCQALNTIGVGTGQNIHIDVSYRPFCTLGGVVKHAVKLGASVTVTCTVDGNPGNSTIKWRYKGTGITINPTVATHSVYGRPRETASTAVISVVKEWQYTDVECVGTNAIGVSMSPCLYRIVRPGHPEVPTNCTWSELNDAEIRVQCNPGFDGGSDQYFVIQQSESGGQYEITLNDTEAMFLVSNLQAGTRYLFKICAASDLYPQLLSCSSEIAAQTSTGNNNQQALASAGSPESAPYIAAGVMGAVVLFILLGLIIFFIRRRRQKFLRSIIFYGGPVTV
ncbi:synaptogenesis protein syg-2-like [Mizuhopecten yessoensis]|uniref:synaptogenesis protein syg-2-like n=1 Tax=Mizuhopecten yessoensis TaxID=6573 RepID=UPI000B45901D|nr:synaptogenesis protein syg-2-like [Mizuhopecten yessoensis]